MVDKETRIRERINTGIAFLVLIVMIIGLFSNNKNKCKFPILNMLPSSSKNALRNSLLIPLEEFNNTFLIFQSFEKYEEVYFNTSYFML
ncbi:hypothetical protein HYW19_02275 [Candidatus Woesearchaeota archaeon]|nr:hypothetical protein [Candidatus Woesearchaeota archaeon]